MEANIAFERGDSQSCRQLRKWLSSDIYTKQHTQKEMRFAAFVMQTVAYWA